MGRRARPARRLPPHGRAVRIRLSDRARAAQTADRLPRPRSRPYACGGARRAGDDAAQSTGRVITMTYGISPRMHKEEVWDRVNTVARTFRGTLIPRLEAEIELAHPVLLDSGQGDQGLRYAGILAQELTRLVTELRELQR